MGFKTGEIMRGIAYYAATQDEDHFFDDERKKLDETYPEKQDAMNRVIERIKRIHSIETEKDIEMYERLIIRMSAMELKENGNRMIVFEKLHELEQEVSELNKEIIRLKNNKPLIIMENHLGEGIYTIESTDEIEMYSERCEMCGDCDTYLGEFTSADEFLADEDGKGYDEDYVRKFFDEELAKRGKKNDY